MILFIVNRDVLKIHSHVLYLYRDIIEMTYRELRREIKIIFIAALIFINET